MNHSSLIKKLRLERGLSQEKLAQGISQRSTLASFENNATKISYNILIQYLDRMNVTLEEYQFMLDDNNLSEKRKLSKVFFDKLRQPYDSEFAKFLHEQYYSTDDYYYKLLYASYVLIRKRENDAIQVDSIDAQKIIKDYLDSIGNWGRFELSIFINTLFCFSDEYIFDHSKRSVKKMKTYVDDLYFNRDMASFLINGTQLAFERGSTELFTYFFRELKQFSDKFNSTDTKIAWKVFSFLSTDDIYDQQKKAELVFALHFWEKDNYVRYVEEKINLLGDVK